MERGIYIPCLYVSEFLGPAKYFCDTCTKSYRSYQGLYEHQRFKCGKKPTYGCPYCSKMCYRKGDLKAHIVSCRKVHNIDNDSFMKTFQELFKKKLVQELFKKK